MTFTNFVCWNLENVRRVMDVEATQASDWIFLATHHPITMYRQELIEASSKIPYSEEQFLKDFLASQDFAFVPVLGQSGTGKSHLIRWLAANIKSAENRKVLLIPKIGTNLKDILGLILEGLKGSIFDEYRERLNRATNHFTEAQACEQLLNQLAAAVGLNGRHNQATLSETEQYLTEELDTILYDPFFRQYWLKKGGIIHQLVIHILGRKEGVENIEERRQFSIHDLPLNLSDLTKAGEQSREFYSLLINDPEIQKVTVDWLNSHLDEAITQVLNLGREDLQRLMREVRETLAEQGVELVLLIEDFAKLQGIDREVLEAVLARPQQPGGRNLCAIRTALACTTGYFDSLIDTVKQRVSFSVTLDIGAINDQSLITSNDIQQFVARYLNAVRLEEAEIQNWFNVRQEETLKSACTECEHHQACHAGFGSIHEKGLYPFTPTALQEMLVRVNPGTFNPRILIKDILKWTLENSIETIQKGQFPPISLREHFGQPKLSAILQSDIRKRDPQNAERREILIDLWTDGTQLSDFPLEIHTAFNLPPLGVTIQPTEITVHPSRVQESAVSYQASPLDKTSSSSKTETVPEKLKQQLETLDNWNNQNILSQDISKDLREFIYPAILERIQWDTEMLLQGIFANSSSKFFKQRNITFHSPKVTRETISGVRLSLPLNPDNSDEFRETTIAFQGILQYNYYKHWNFPDGTRYFSTYAKYLERWSQYVLEKIRLYPRESGEVWNPVPAAVELLAIGATMAGHPTQSLEDLINSLFLPLESTPENQRSSKWKQLFQVFQKNHSELLEIITSRTACTKGSSKQFQIIDTVQILDPLKQVMKTGYPQCEIPEDVGDQDLYTALSKTRQKVDDLLEQATQEEQNRLLEKYDYLVRELGEEFNKSTIIEEIQKSIEVSKNGGVFGLRSSDELNTIINQFRQAPIAKYMKSMRLIKSENDRIKLLRYLSDDHESAITTAFDFIKATNNFLDQSIKRAETEIENLQSSEAGAVDSIQKQIQDGFEELKNLLTQIKG